MERILFPTVSNRWRFVQLMDLVLGEELTPSCCKGRCLRSRASTFLRAGSPCAGESFPVMLVDRFLLAHHHQDGGIQPLP